jgi:hypothetical protein
VHAHEHLLQALGHGGGHGRSRHIQHHGLWLVHLLHQGIEFPPCENAWFMR